jgi:hypothetical protein
MEEVPASKKIAGKGSTCHHPDDQFACSSDYLSIVVYGDSIMTKVETLIHEIEDVPDFIVEELLDFARYLKFSKLSKASPATVAGESIEEELETWDRASDEALLKHDK